MKKMLIYTTTSGEIYNSFALIYIYSAHILYPEYDIKIRIWEDNVEKYQTALGEIGLNPNIIKKINPKYFKTIRNTKTVRWLYDPEDIQDYEYVYTGDIDCLMTPNYPKILEYNREHCEQTKFCYSNSVRSPHYVDGVNVNLRRFRGWHFYKPKEYIEATLKYTQSVHQKLLKSDYSVFEHKDVPTYTKVFPTSDEQFIYNLIEQSGLPIDHDDPWKFQTIGLHMGRYRSFKSEEIFRNDHQDGNYFLNLYNNDPKFKKLLTYCCPKVQDIVRFMAEYYTRNLR